MGAHHSLPLGTEIQAVRMQDLPLHPHPKSRRQSRQAEREPRESGNEEIMNEQDGLFVNVCEINEQRLLQNTEGMKSIPRSQNNEGINRITRLRPE